MNRSTILTRRGAAVAASSLLALCAASCGLGDPTAAVTSTTAPPDPSSLVEIPPPVRVSVCFDGSPSVDAASRSAAIDALSGLVSSWTPDAPGAADAVDGSSPEVVGLELRVRKVMGGDVPTGSAGAQVVYVQIPSIPAVRATPDPEAPDWDHQVSVQRAQRIAADDAADDSGVASAEGATAVLEADYTASSSEVLGCLESAARADQAADLVLVSDLNQQDDNGRPLELSGRTQLQDRRILIVEACGTQGLCGAQTAAWEEELAEAGATVQVTAPEAMATELPRFLAGGS